LRQYRKPKPLTDSEDELNGQQLQQCSLDGCACHYSETQLNIEQHFGNISPVTAIYSNQDTSLDSQQGEDEHSSQSDYNTEQEKEDYGQQDAKSSVSSETIIITDTSEESGNESTDNDNETPSEQGRRNLSRLIGKQTILKVKRDVLKNQKINQTLPEGINGENAR
jgi:hypothetical protein